MSKSFRRTLAASALILSGVLLGSAISSFAAPSNKVVNACVDRRTGAMRYVANGKCKSSELLISWNVQGPTGPRGLAGEQGNQGLQGPRGASADQPNTVHSGSSAPTSALGNVGDFFIDSVSNSIYGPKTAAGWPTGVSLVGPTGATGAVGAAGPTGAQGPIGPSGSSSSSQTNTVRSGSGVPSSAIGTDGDFYIDTASNKIHGPKATGNWPAGVSLIGPTGSTGATGAAGTNGTNGATGPGSLEPLAVTSIARAGTAPTTYSNVYSLGSDIAIGISCYTLGGIYTYALATKAPTGTTVTGFGHFLSTADNYFAGVVGVSNGSMTRMKRYASPSSLFASSSDDFYRISIFGPTVTPVVVSIQVIQDTNSCHVSGYVESGQ